MGRERTGAALLVVAWLTAPAPTTAATRREAVVVRSVENMYSAPSTEKDVVSQAFLGQVVGVVEVKGGFARIETPDGYTGFIPLGALSRYPGAATPRYATRGIVAEVTSLIANIYRESDVTTARPKTRAPLSARLEVTDGPIKDRWYEVRLPNGEIGFVQKGDVRITEASASRPVGAPEELVATARRLLGTPYLWGGMTPLGVDCSGFAALVYRVQGRVLPRDAHLQFADPSAAAVDRALLQPGDLVFFGRSADKITHVGLFVGDGRFISATTYETPVVREDRLDDPHWAEIYQGARRPR